MSPGLVDLAQRMEGVRRYVRRRSAAVAAMWIAAGCGLLWILAWVTAGAAGWRGGSLAPLAFDLALLVWVVGGWMGVRRWLSKSLAEERLARVVEEAASLRRGDVLGPLELSRAVPAGVSGTLADRAARSAAERLGAHGPEALSGGLGSEVRRWSGRGRGALVVATSAVVALTAWMPARSTQVWKGLASPISVLQGPALPPLEVWPGDVEVMRGSDLEIRVAAPGRRSVEFRWQAVGEVARAEQVEVENDEARFTLRAVSARTEYAVWGDDGTGSRRFQAEPVDPLFVTDLRIELAFPPHTGLAPETVRGAAPEFRVPDGTRFTFEGRANRPLASVELIDSTGGAAAGLTPRSDGFGGGWTPEASGRYQWELRDGSGAAPAVQPDPLRVALVPDARPVVDISVPGADTVLAADLRQQLVIEAADDYGLRTLEMTAVRVTAAGERREPVTQRFELGGTRLVSAAPVLDFGSWGLMPGDEVRYLARVQDNAPNGQWAETREYTLRMPSASDLRRGVEESLEDAASRLAELAARTAEQAERNREEARRRALGRTGRAGAESGQGADERAFQEREALQQALDAQRETMAAVDSLGAELAALEGRMAEAGLADPDLRDQMRALQQLLAELGDDALRGGTEQLSEALARNDNAAAGRSLEQLATEQATLRERLESSLERFQRAAVEQDFRATRSEATDLARQERALADALREDGATPQRIAQQETLEQQAAALEARLDRLEERLRELGEEGAADRVAQAADQASQARGQMGQAAAEARQGRAEDAASRAEDASAQMEQAAGALQEAEQDMAGQQMDRLLEALERTAYDALALARRQTDLGEAMGGATNDALQRMRIDEASLAQGVANIAENLQQGAGGEIPGGREISAAIGRALESIDRTLAFMERPRSLGGSPVTESERVVADLNRLAVITLRIVDQLGGMGQGSTRDGPPMQQALENLAQQQGDLVNQAGQIMPMELGEAALAEALQQLAEEQQSVSDQLGELATDPEAEGALGDLDQLSAEALALAEALAQGQLDPETVRRQERLFHRLLDAGRSLEREEFSEERQGEAAGDFERGTVLPLDGGALGLLPYEMPSAAQLQELTPPLRRLIVDYFDRLNRAPTPPVGGGR